MDTTQNLAEVPAVQTTESAPRLPPIPKGDSFDQYGVHVNQLSVDELFGQYEKAGFLYAAKMRRLGPFLPLVKENWRKALRAGELILWVATYGRPQDGEWASISSWMSTDGGWVSQHLVSSGSPVASRAVMLAGSAVRQADRPDVSHQSWFRRENRYANRIFGSAASVLGPAAACMRDYAYLALPVRRIGATSRALTVNRASPADRAELIDFLSHARSSVFMQGEGYSGDDLELENVDQLYRRVGLRRYRHIFLVRERHSSQLVGVGIAHRGPLGLNFSFLENRYDQILRPDLPPALSESVCQALCNAAFETYADFEPQVIPVVVSLPLASTLVGLGAEHVRNYAQILWLRPGFERWYRHTESIYEALMRAGKRRGLGNPALRQPHG